jgi:hypothetical protein
MRRTGVLMSKNGFNNAPDLGNAMGFAIEGGKKPKIRFDAEKYMALIDDPDLSDLQKEQIVEALWNIGMVFYDMGFGVELIGEACGKLGQGEDASAAGPPDVVASKANTLRETINLCAAE